MLAAVASKFEFEIGDIYKFRYNGRMRLALVLEYRFNSVHCWDFTADNYRNFDLRRVDNLIEKVTDKVVISNEPLGYTDSNVHTCEANGKFYAVRF